MCVFELDSYNGVIFFFLLTQTEVKQTQFFQVQILDNVLEQNENDEDFIINLKEALALWKKEERVCVWLRVPVHRCSLLPPVINNLHFKTHHATGNKDC